MIIVTIVELAARSQKIGTHLVHNCTTTSSKREKEKEKKEG